ncbi:C6 zinc finger domain protein [Penicillium sp. IBT 16267x]|nr:C6 zinc finger domain protein [Penicillium sp. IBT 16267x]
MHELLACCGAEIPTHDPTIRELARFHYTRAVAALRRILNDGNIKSHWMVTMLTVMMLCIYERSKIHRSSGVEVHLAGAARLIQVCSQDDARDSEPSGIQQSMHRLVRESFIFHVATSLPFQSDHMHQMEIETAFGLAEEAIYPHFLSDDSSHSDSPVLGFSPKLFRCIYMVYRLYQTSQWSSVHLQTCQDLGQDLIQWSHHIPTSRHDKLLDHQTDPGMSHDSIVPSCAKVKSPSQPASLGPTLYILGCRILLHRMSSACTGSEPDLERLLQEGIAAVRQLQPTQDYFAEYYCWPLLIIGMNLERQSDRELLMSKVHAFWVATNNGTMRRLVDKLLRLWE